MNFNIQPTLTNGSVTLQPLQATDFKALYNVASDAKIWEQHPNRDRYQRDVFLTFFEGAMQSSGAFKVIDNATGQLIGSTRFYDHSDMDGSIFIGYTFYAINCWGKSINQAVKAMMLDYIFQYVNVVRFHIGAGNVRSQIAIGRLGAIKTDEQQVTYFGEASKLNFVYEISKEAWLDKM
ncbi:GNAT family N-acetyltransferase [Mucilaginibacter sp. CSA2-8R]|uniref:GNAT family N-acetyltransferase n=1 Tax=Mucilaginibacter sp. CSA2-8R TaxID=3141542 RepID=UPI00315C99D0